MSDTLFDFASKGEDDCAYPIWLLKDDFFALLTRHGRLVDSGVGIEFA